MKTIKNRELYLQKMINFKDSDLIKVITGVRRCGKSSMLVLFKNYLLENGVNENNIIEINFESLQFEALKDYKSLYDYIKSKIDKKKGKYYILLDEIQEVDSWEKALSSFRIDFDCDIYATGSNAHLLSGELSTYLSGRCIQIKMLPLSFKEFLEWHRQPGYFIDKHGEYISDGNNNFEGGLADDGRGVDGYFYDYLLFGGLPSLFNLNQIPNTKMDYLRDIYDMVIKREVIQRNKITDVGLLEKIVIFISQNIGNTVSSKSISDYLTSNGNPTTHNTVDNYLKYLENAYIIYKAQRYDIKGKEILKTLGKYYIVDSGLRNTIIGQRDDDIGHMLENIVYLELIRRGYEVTIGKNDDLEIDFIATNTETKKYYQVAATVLDKDVLEREKKPFNLKDDHFEKIILSMDKTFLKTTENGIKFVNIIDFLMED